MLMKKNYMPKSKLRFRTKVFMLSLTKIFKFYKVNYGASLSPIALVKDILALTYKIM